MSDAPSPRNAGTLDGVLETAFTVLLPIFSAFVIWQSTQVTEPPRNIVVGPRTFPLMVSWAMLAVSVMLVWQRLRAITARRAAAAPPNEFAELQEADDTSISDWPAVWSVLGSLLALCLLLEPVGFVATIFFFLCGLSTLFSPRRWLLNLVVALAFSLFFYYLFTRVLEIPLPKGILSFLW